MATKKKEDTPVADSQNEGASLQEENREQTANATESGSDQGEPQEIPQIAGEAAETSKSADVETKPSDADVDEPVEKPAAPKMENLSVLADRHRIPAWQQAALLRYMGWEAGKMVTDEDYRNALDQLEHRRIGGGRK